MAVPAPKRQFTVDEYYRMAEAGILGEYDRVELIDGEIVQMSPIGAAHAACVMRLTSLLSRLVGETAIVSIQNPVRVSDLSEPEPDVSLLKPSPTFYSESHPRPEDVLLVIEVADSTLAYDRGFKMPFYARAGITEAWLVDLTNQAVEVYARLSAGRYRETVVYGRGETIASRGVPGLALAVDDIIGRS